MLESTRGFADTLTLLDCCGMSLQDHICDKMCCIAMQGGWQNRILARLANEMSRYNPIHYVPKIKAPVLLVATSKDTLCPIAVARKAAELNSNVQLLEKDVGALLQFCLPD